MNYTKEDVINALGIGSLAAELQEQVIGAFLNTLEARTGEAVSASLSDEQLQEFTTIVDSKGDEAAEQWLKETVAGYDGIEEVEYNKLVAEIQAAGDAMLGT